MAGVLIKKQEKVSNRSGKKYAFLQISDPTGVFEVTLFAEILAQARAYLEPGQTLLISVTAEQREDQVRYTAQSVETLDERLERTLREVRLHLTNSSAVKKLQSLLSTEGKGNVKVSITIDAEDGEMADIAIPGSWNFSVAARNAIRKTEGVSDLQEI
jgi:DNA polymerase-3 subunit alpha